MEYVLPFSVGAFSGFFFFFIIFFFFLTMLAFLLPGQTTADAETGFAYAENPELLELLPF